MGSALGVLLVVAGGGGLLALGLAARARERALGRRVDAITRVPLRRLSAGEPSRAMIGLRRFFTFRMRRSWGVSANPVYLLLAGIVAAAAIWLLGGVPAHLPGYVPAIAAAGGFFLTPRIILMREQRRSDAQFAELLPDAIDMVVRIVRAGLPVGPAIRTVGQEANPPISTMFAKIADQVGNPDFRFFAVAVSLQQSTGGNLAATLETLSQIIRRRRAVRLRAGAATAEVRISAIVLGAIPFFVTAALLLVAPNYLDPLFADLRGNVILGLALFGLLLAGVTMRALIRNSLRV